MPKVALTVLRPARVPLRRKHVAPEAARLRREAPDDLEGLRARFGHATLKAVLLATELFDVAEEPTPGGGSRTIYRINERWRLESPPVDSTAGKSESR